MYGVFLVWFKLLLCYAVFVVVATHLAKNELENDLLLSSLVSCLPVYGLFNSFAMCLVFIFVTVFLDYVSANFKVKCLDCHFSYMFFLLVVANNHVIVEVFDLWLLSFGIT